MKPDPSTIAAEIRRQTADRAPKTICPSEVARALVAEEAEWRALMPRVREVAATLPDIRATQAGREVDPTSAKGPIRLSKRPD